ncbi:MAG: MFS transporter, partial [Pseudomonadota bacterium]
MELLRDIALSRRALAGFVLIGVAWASYFAQMPVIKAALGVSDGVYGSVILFASFGAIAAMWLAPLADRLAGPWALPLGALGVGLGFLWAGAAPGLVSFALAMTLASAGSGVVDVLANARLANLEAASGRALMNLNHGLYGFAYAGAALLVGWAREAGWSPTEVFLALMVVTFLCAALMAGNEASGTVPEAAQARLPRDAIVWLVGLLVFAAFLTEASTEGWSALHLERTLGGGPAEGALGPAILGLTMGFGRLFGHALAARVSEMAMLVAALALSCLGLIVAGAAPSLPVAYAGFGLAGLGISVVVPVAFSLLGRAVTPDRRLRAISLASAIGYAAFFAGPPLMGLVSQAFSLRVSFYVVAALLVLVLALLIPALARQFRMA